MNKLAVCALALVLSAGSASAGGVSISLNSDDSHTEMGPRHHVRDARLAMTTRDGSTTMMLFGDVLAVQLTDKALAAVSTGDKDANFLEELLASGVRLAVGKSVEYPIANLRRVEYRDGALHLTNDANKPVFSEMKVNGRDVLRNFAPADAKRFADALRAALASR